MGAAHHDISAVPGLDDRHQSAFSTMTVEMRYRIFEREHAPIGLTLGFDPHWFRIDDIGGDRVDGYGVDFLLIADQELVADRIFGSLNLVGAPDAQRSRVTGAWQHESRLGVSAALAWQVRPEAGSRPDHGRPTQSHLRFGQGAATLQTVSRIAVEVISAGICARPYRI